MAENKSKSTIEINDEIHLSPPTTYDITLLVKHLKAKEIYMRTQAIPFPYKEEHAEWFIDHAREKEKEYERPMEWAIRNSKNELIGMIGLHGKYGKSSHRDEIGYWISKDYWGKGIMSKVLQKICDVAINDYKLVRIEAPIFAFNLHSQKVAEKCGFALEGTFQKAYYKDGTYFDCKFYALVK